MKLHHALRRAHLVALLIAIPALFGAVAEAQSNLVNQVNTLALPTTAVPVVQKFTLTAGGTFQVTLTDQGMLATPSAPLASVALAISSGNTILGTPITAIGANGTATTTFTATAAGDYYVRVVGMPGTVPGSGAFGVAITNTANSSQVFGFSSSLALPLTQASDVTVLTDTFTVSNAGTYTIKLTDLAFPSALTTVQLALTAPGVSPPLATLSGTQLATVTLNTGTTYSVFAFGEATATANAGLYNVVVRDTNNTIVYNSTLTVGAVTSLGSFALNAGPYTLGFTDLKLPAALSGTGPNGAFVTQGENVAAHLATAGTLNFTTASTGAGTYNAYSIGTAASTPGAGSYAVQVVPTGGGAAALSVAQAVTTATSTTKGTQAFTFNATVSSAGTYNVEMDDYQLPNALSNVVVAAVQGATSLATPLSAPGTLSVPASAGTLTVLVFTQPPVGDGVFRLFVNPASGGGAPILETTQGVGGVFTSIKVPITSTGNYLTQVTDLGFPLNFSSLYVLVTQGSTVVGSLVGGGALPFTASATGNYFVTFTAIPAPPPTPTSGGPQLAGNAGTYAITVGTPPPAPTVTLTSDVASVSSGNSANLTWSSTGATSCTASGSWSGGKALSGTANTGNLTASSTYTLACTGLGGTTTKSVTVTVNSPSPPPSSVGGGGGGALDLRLLALLAFGLLLRITLSRRTPLGLARRYR